METTSHGTMFRCRAIVIGCVIWMLASWLLVVGWPGPGTPTVGLASPLAGRILAIWLVGVIVAWPILVLILHWTGADALARVGTVLVVLALGLAPLSWWAGWPRTVDVAILVGAAVAMAALEGAVALVRHQGLPGRVAAAVAVVVAGSMGGATQMALQLGESPAAHDAAGVALSIVGPAVIPLAVAALGLVAKAIGAR